MLKKYVIGFILVAALAGAVAYFAVPPSQTQESSVLPQEIKGSISVAGVLGENFSVPSGTTAFGLLQNIQKARPELLKLATKEYAGLGTLVTAMGGKENGQESKYWQYYVNGVQAQVGSDSYVLREGDRIEWKFEKSEF